MPFKIGCVIPCYKGNEKTFDVVNNAMKYVDKIVFVDDCCPYQTGLFIEEKISKKDNLKIIFNQSKLGVGGACKLGFNYLLKDGCQIIIKIDADGQMNPHLIPKLIYPIINGDAEAVKGNRFTRLEDIKSMPKMRLFGNLGLSFLNKVSTGYWELFDPTNGFLAFSNSIIANIDFEKIDNNYFFESDLLFQCALNNIYFAQMRMHSVYENESSALKPIKEIFRFSFKHFLNFFKRIFYQYFILDFNVGSLDLIGLGMAFFLLILISFKVLIRGILIQVYASPGEANLITILTLISTQLFLGFLYFDSTQKPLIRRIFKNQT